MDARATAEPIGLTRIILDALLDATPEVLASGEVWNADLLDRVEEHALQSLPPRPSHREQAIFDMVWRRSFAEAREILLGMDQDLTSARSLLAHQSPLQASAI